MKAEFYFSGRIIADTQNFNTVSSKDIYVPSFTVLVIT